MIVVDAGEPRNAPAEHMHSFLGREGEPPAELTRAGRDEVRSYGGEILAGRAERVTRTEDGRFRVELDGDRVVVARRVLAATGLVDVLPDIDGLAEHWGRDVIHCPFCHGYEVARPTHRPDRHPPHGSPHQQPVPSAHRQAHDRAPRRERASTRPSSMR